MSLTVHMFSLTTCGPCKQVKPILDKLATEYDDLHVSYTVVNQDEDGIALADEWGVQSVPTLIFIQDREEKSRSVGLVNEETLRRYVQGFVQRSLLSEPSGGSGERSGPVLCGISRPENTES